MNGPRPTVRGLIPYFFAGILFGLVATQSQIISWYRIYEMFLFHDFHMYGVLFSAISTAALGVWILERSQARAFDGNRVTIQPKSLGKGIRYVVGGAIFGLGWGLVGACPGPIFALLGHGVAGAGVLLLGALLGTWSYALMRSRLPH